MSASNSHRADEYLIMDGRAKFDIGEASVFEAVGTNRPSKKYVLKEWGEGATVVRCFGWDGKAFTQSEVVWENTP